MDKMNIDLEKLDESRRFAIKMILLQDGDAIVNRKGEKEVVKHVAFMPWNSVIYIGGAYFDIEGFSTDSDGERDGDDEIVDVIFADRNK